MRWPEEPPFLVPDGVAEAISTAVRERGSALRRAGEENSAGYRQEQAEEATEMNMLLAGKLPDGWDAEMPTFPTDPKGLATRDAGGKVLNAIAGRIPRLVGGSADLTPPTKTDIKGAVSFERCSYVGLRMHLGVREHSMPARRSHEACIADETAAFELAVDQGSPIRPKGTTRRLRETEAGAGSKQALVAHSGDSIETPKHASSDVVEGGTGGRGSRRRDHILVRWLGGLPFRLAFRLEACRRRTAEIQFAIRRRGSGR